MTTIVNKFAHLLGRRTAAAASILAEASKAEEKKDDQMEEGGGDGTEEDPSDKGKKGKKAKRAEEPQDDQDKNGSEDDGDGTEEEGDPSDKGKKGKKAKKADDETTDEQAEESDEDKEKAAVARGRRLERERCARIFSCKAAGDRPDLAAQAAFGSSMSADEAIKFLNAAAAGHSGLDRRMAQSGSLRVGINAPEEAATNTLADKIVMAGKMRRGEI